MKKFDYIAIIYNPNSTGKAVELAHELAERINEHKKEIGISPAMTPTKHAMHAHTLAKEISMSYQHPLIVSVSGDGGYNEIINGIMEAKQLDGTRSPVAAVIAAGNANDHKRMTRGDTDLVDLIIHHEPKPLDLLELTAKDSSLIRRAHSYIGLGISPKVGYELNKHRKNPITEAVILFKTFWKFRPFTIEHENKRVVLDSLVFANISEMAKVLKLEPETDVTNNRFRAVEFPHRTKFHLLLNVLTAVFSSTKSHRHVDQYQFRTIQKELVQFDGEVEHLDAGVLVTVKSLPGAILSLYDA